MPRDLEPFFDSAQEVKDAYAMLDQDGDGKVTMRNMVDAIMSIYKVSGINNCKHKQ